MLLKINTDRRCFFVLNAHIEKEIDDMTGVRRIMVSTIGAKLAPKIPPYFSEVVLSSRKIDANGNAEFAWSTIDASMDLKNRSLPVGAKLAQSFGPIVAAHKRRKGLAGASPQAPAMVQPEAPKVTPPVAPMRPAATTPPTSGTQTASVAAVKGA